MEAACMSVGRELSLGAGISYLLNDYTAKEDDTLPQQPWASQEGVEVASRALPPSVMEY